MKKIKKLTRAELDELAAKSSIAIFGSDDKLEKQSDKLKDVIKQTMIAMALVQMARLLIILMKSFAS